MSLITIRDFGNDTSCYSSKELEESLNNYLGRSIALHYKKPSGITMISYWDVSKAGVVTESYGEQQIINAQSFYESVQ